MASLQGTEMEEWLEMPAVGLPKVQNYPPLEKATQKTTWALVYTGRHIPLGEFVLTGTPNS